MSKTDSRRVLFLWILSVLTLTLFSQIISAEPVEPDASLCPVQSTAFIQHTPPPIFSEENIGNTKIGADTTQSGTDSSISLDGNVVIEQHKLRLSADHAQYDKQQETLQVSGNVHIDSESMFLEADSGTINISNNASEEKATKSKRTGQFSNIKFLIPDSQMKGKAKSIRMSENSEGNKTSTLNNANITSCDLFDPDWLISAEEIRLDHDDEYGSADNVVIRFKDIPFLYIPYMAFPTSDKRRSGLLSPEFGTSTSRGIELAVPWYWNIAPNHDAVITPRYMEKRGTEVGGNYRYLTQSTNGKLVGAYLPNDDITQDNRYQVRYTQQTRILSNLLLDVDVQDISDSEYFNDFSNNLGSTSQTHLFSNATLRYNLNNWHMRVLAQDIKTIDRTTAVSSRPYERLPQLTLNGDTEIANSALLFTLDSEFVDFAHEDKTNVTGTRLTVRPGLRLPLSGTAWFFEPAIKFSHTQYDVGTDGNSTQPSTNQSVDDRNIPMSSIDAGLFFNRVLENGYTQTLEPRLYYLNVPFEDQSDAPIFDTSTPEFSVAQLFRDNRFIGGDRIGDTNQLTLALTSRILNPETGDEFLRASIGQIFFFEDKRVSLSTTPNSIIDTSRQSDVIAELDTIWGRWQSNIDIQWDTSDNKLSKENYFLHYKSDNNHLFNIGYRKRLRDNTLNLEQTDTSFVYAINNQYNTFFRWNYSLKDNKDIDTIAGIAYDSCCWSIQLLAQRRLKNSTTDNNAYDNSILVQFVFKGLGSVSGSSAKDTLERSIYSYSDTLQQ
ncbi:LPS-assembly protein LptD @ Organic solvent tolerance protein precursor [hydrothermal vent metagenome]|uniref:LPS-assembly protein LptD @ Organic solvent tolerance protein n=1 Tax=hydrothermal vent metagenome TaxID=652676 RepID=A0A3B0WKT5_9ZZZZ